jgi:IS1 family transposase/transposase-like protein
MPDLLRLEHCLLLVMWVYVLRVWWRLNKRRVKGWWQRVKDHLPMKRHPKSPKDCPHCCQGVHLGSVRINHAVTPWGEVKSKRGRKKQNPTQGWACLDPACPYFGITEEVIHALVRHTLRGKDRDIPYLRCQCCQTVFSSRKGTPLYYLKTKTDRVEMVLWFLAEGVNRAVLVRYTGQKDATLARWLERMGEHSQGLHNRLFRGLVLSLVQLDELYAQVKDREQARWLWLVIDPVTKVIPTLHLGGRKRDDAYAVAHDLKERVAPDCVPNFMTDGLWMYFYALTAHFGHWFRPPRARTDHWQPDKDFRHAQLVKRTHRRQLTYTIRRMAWGKRSELFEVLAANGFRQTIQTAFIERLNLTFRQGIAGLGRQTWALASEQHLLLHAEWFRLYYHLVRPHESLREPTPGGKGNYRARTPAMAAGLTDRVLTVGDILRMPLIPAAA